MRGNLAAGTAVLATFLPVLGLGAAFKGDRRSEESEYPTWVSETLKRHESGQSLELLKRQQPDASCVQDGTLADLSASPAFEPFCSSFLGIGPTFITSVVTPTV